MIAPRSTRTPLLLSWALACLVLACGLICPESSHARPKTDLIGMVDGDRMTVEIKELQRGKLTCKTHSMGTVVIEWEDIVELSSGFYFRVANSEGRMYFGSISIRPPEVSADSTVTSDSMATSESARIVQPFDERTLYVGVGTMVLDVPMKDVVEITAIERSFMSRIDGSLAIAYTFTKVSDVAEFTFDWRNIYREERNRLTLDAITSVTQTGSEGEPRRRLDYSGGYSRRLVKSWSAYTSLGFQRNDELGVRARYLGSLGAGFSPISSNYNSLSAILGAALNAEEGADQGSFNVQWEAQIGSEYQLYLYNSPKTDVKIRMDGFIGLTTADRYRVDFETKLRREIFNDFYIDFTYYISWDNKNPTTGTESTDYGLSTGVSWTY